MSIRARRLDTAFEGSTYLSQIILIQHFCSIPTHSLSVRAQKKGKEFPELFHNSILFSVFCQVKGEHKSTDSRDVEETLY